MEFHYGESQLTSINSKSWINNFFCETKFFIKSVWKKINVNFILKKQELIVFMLINNKTLNRIFKEYLGKN